MYCGVQKLSRQDTRRCINWVPGVVVTFIAPNDATAVRFRGDSPNKCRLSVVMHTPMLRVEDTVEFRETAPYGCSVMEELVYFCDTQRHLVCKPYSIDNLHRMAEQLNIKRCWFHKSRHPHYDIPKRRIDEISSKCVVVGPREILKICSLN